MANLPVFAKSGRKMLKGRRVLSSNQKKAVTQIAKRAVIKTAETKSTLGTYTPTCVDDILYCQNLTYGISQGTTYASREGQKINLRNFYIKGKLQAVNNATVGNGSTTFRVMLIRTDLALTTTNTSIATTDVFRSGANTYMATSGIPDLNKVHILYDKQYTMKTDITATNQHIPFSINKKINKTVFYTSGSASYLKDDQYYLLITVGKTDGTAGTAGLALINWAVNFKDI